jgi:O-antigen/teichoic acid export membrane protein
MTRASVFWSAARNLVQRLGTILTFIVLARLLSPEEIGTFAAAAAVIALLELFADNGLGDALVQSNKTTSRVATAVLLLNVVIAMVLCAAVILFAPAIGALLGAGDIDAILRVASIVLILNALCYVPQALLRKEFAFQRLAVRTLAATIAGATTGVSMALLGFGVWSMVGQLIVTALLNLALAWYPLVLRLSQPDFKGAAPLVQFGSHVFASRMLYFSSSRLIEIVIPAFFGPAALGLYFMGSRLPAVLAQLISAVMVDVSLPLFSKLAHDRDELSRVFFGNVEVSAAIAAAAFLGLGALAPEVSAIAFGPNGAGTEFLILPLAVLGGIQAIGFYNGVLLSACGHPNIEMRISFAAATLATLMFVALKDTNINIFIYGFAGVQGLMVLIGFLIGSRYTGLSPTRLLRTCGPFFLAGGVALGLVELLRPQVIDHLAHAPPRGLVLSLVFTGTYLLLVAALDRKALGRVWQKLARRGQKAPPGPSLQ